MNRGWRRTRWQRIYYGLEDGLRWVLQLLILPITLIQRGWATTMMLASGTRPRRPRRGFFGLLQAYIRWPFIELVRLFRWLAHLAYMFWPRANYRLLLQGLPALIIAILVMLPLAGRGSAKSRGDYENAAVQAVENKNYEAADIYFRALSELDKDNAAYRFQLAQTAEMLGDHQRANALVDTLASRDATGYPSAHLWQAQRLLQNPTGPESVAYAEAHLLRALEAKGVAVQAHTLLGQIYLLKRQLDEAAEHFSAAAPYKPELYIALAKVRMLQNNPQQARADAEKALAHFTREEEKNLDNHQARLFLAESMLVLQQFKLATEMLEKGMKLSDDPRYPAALSRVYFTWYELAKRMEGPNAPNDRVRAVLLRNALRYDPENRTLLHQLTTSLKKNGADVALVRDVLRQMQVNGDRPDIINLLLAIDAEQRQLTQSSDRFLSQAYAYNPKSLIVLSDLARSFVETPPHDEAVAQELTAMGLRTWPNDPNLHYVRGYLHARHGRWLDALQDFLVASSAMPNDVRLNRMIAESYARLGNRSMAESYLRKSLTVRSATVQPIQALTTP